MNVTNFVLVHGSWHGRWCRKKMLPYLRKYGHDVYFPTLTGLEEIFKKIEPYLTFLNVPQLENIQI